MTNPQNLEPCLSRVEIDMADLKQVVAETSRNVLELRSTVSTLADLITIQQQEAERDRSETNRRFEESRQRFDQFVEHSDQNQAIMLQLIQAIAQGNNGRQ